MSTRLLGRCLAMSLAVLCVTCGTEGDSAADQTSRSDQESAVQEGAAEHVSTGHSHGTDEQSSPTFDPSPARAFLRDLVVAQTYFVAGHGRYATEGEELLDYARLTVPDGLSMELAAVDSIGFSIVTSASDPPEECAIMVGSIDSPREYATEEGRLHCAGDL